MRKIPTSLIIMGLLVVGAVAIIGFTMWSNNQRLADIKLPIEIKEFFDYRCPHCADFYPVIEELKATYGDKVAVTYRQYPFLTTESDLLAYGAIAAEKQGKFLEYHTEVFEVFNAVREGTADISALTPEGVAQTIGLDMTQFATDIQSDEVKQVVEQHIAEGNQLGVTGTPTVFLFDKSIPARDFAKSTATGTDYQPFKDTIKRLIERAEQNK